MKTLQNNFVEAIGNTPLFKLKAASEITGCNIYGKAEYLNPGGSVKDRAALACLLYTSPSPRDDISSRMPSSA